MRTSALALILTALAACNGCNDTPDVAELDQRAMEDEGVVVVLSPDEDPADLDLPVSATLRATGPWKVVPRHVLMRFNQSVFDEDQIGTEPEGLDFSVSPEIDGTLRVAATDLVEFTPTNGFPPGGSWTATLASVTPRNQPTTKPEQPWSVEVVSPPFEVASVRLRDRNPGNGSVTLEVIYSADVSASAVRDKLSIEVAGRPVLVNQVSQGEPHAVLVTASVPRTLTGQQHVRLTIDEGVPHLLDEAFQAPAFDTEVALPKGPEVEIRQITLREGHDGFYLEVVCDDSAAGGERYWWDREMRDSWWVSSRCLIDESSADQFIRTEPASPVTVAPGPAGFRVFGDFGRGELKVHIDAGATTADGGVVYEAATEAFTVPARSAKVSFTSKGRYLPTSSWKNLGIQHMNVSSLKLQVRHVPERNLVFWLTGTEPTTNRTSDLLLDTSIAVANPPDQLQSSWIPINELVADPQPGIYELSIQADNRKDSARLMLTDMHLVAKRGSTEDPDGTRRTTMQVWALDVHDGSALSGVDVRVVRASGKGIGGCTTSGDLGCAIVVDKDGDPSPPVALLAKKGSDLTYIKFDDLELDAPEDTSGVAYTSILKHSAPLYTDRGVYRPGDTAHVSGVVRNREFVAPDSGLPVVVKLFDPKGREIKKRVLHTNHGGMVTTDFRFGDYQITGHYRATAEIGETLAGEARFQVEEFVPERLKVTAEASEAGYLLGDPAPVVVAAEWLFGGATKGARVEVQCSLEAHEFRPKGHDGFSFGPAHLSGKPNPITLGTLESSTDDEGLTTVECPAPEGSVGSMGPGLLVAQAAVFEGESGRTTVATARVPIHPTRTYVGLDTTADKAERGKAFEVQGRVVDWEGKPAGAGREYTVEVYRMEEELSWWWEDEGGSQERQLRPAREQREVVKADSSGTFSVKVTPEEDSAGTLVRVRGEEGTLSELFVEGTGRRYWWSDSRQAVDSTPRPARPVGLAIDVPDRIPVGEPVEVSVVAPYAGRMLFTVETDELLDAVWVDAVPGRNDWTFQVGEFTPNVYVSAFLVKDPHLESAVAFMPDRAYGVESVEVIPDAFEQKLTLTVPDEVQPYSPLKVSVDVGTDSGPTYATIAVVDEGILSLTRFEDPDPLGYVFRQRGLGVDSFETIGWTLLLDPAGPSSSTGGDEGEPSGRVQMVKPVALWSGIVEADANGVVNHTFEMPGYRGKVRVMVVTSNQQRVGAASAQVTVRDPLVLQTTLPRFLLTGDVAQIPVMVANMSGTPQDVTIALTAEELQVGATPDVTDGSEPVPILEFLGEPTGMLKLAADEAKTAVFQVRTRDIPGAARLLVTARAGALRSKEELDIPIQAAASDTRVVQRRALDGGTNDLLADYDGWLAGTDRSTLWVTSNPYAQAMTHLRYLVRYPFG